MKKLIVITGASSGIGMETAKKFSENGHPTLLISRRKEIMDNLNLKNSISVKADVTNLEEVRAAIKMAEDKYGKTDLLINCAGVMLLGNIDKQSYEEWKNMIDVNINGILTTTNIILPDMIKRNEGTIINISSIAGRKTFKNHGVYQKFYSLSKNTILNLSYLWGLAPTPPVLLLTQRTKKTAFLTQILFLLHISNKT